MLPTFLTLTELAGKRLKMAKECHGLTFEGLVEDERWQKIVQVFDERTIRRWVKNGIIESKIGLVSKYFDVPSDYFIDPAISNAEFRRKIFLAKFKAENPHYSAEDIRKFEERDNNIIEINGEFLKHIVLLVVRIKRGEQVDDVIRTFLGAILPSSNPVTHLDTLVEALKGAAEFKWSQEINATIFHMLGNIYMEFENFEKAVPLLTKAITIREQILGENQPDTLDTYSHCGIAYWSLGQYQEAITLFGKIHEIQEKNWGAHDIKTIEALNNLGVVLHYSGKVTEAKVILERVHETIQELLKTDFSEALSELAMQSVSNLSWVLKDLGMYSEAKILAEKAVELYSARRGKNHTDTLTVTSNLAHLLFFMNNFREAEEIFVQVMTERQKKLGSEHSYTVMSQHDYAMVNFKLGNVKKAQVMISKTLQFLTDKFGKTHPERLKHLHSYGIIMMEQGDLGSAERSLKEAYRFRLKNPNLGKEHDHTLGSLFNLGCVYEKKSKLKKAVSIYNYLLKVFSSHGLDESHPYVKFVSENLLSCLNRLETA